ncbi:MAG: rRNA maturation RNase YbeY [Cyclobacteriaceae bacterium]
MAAVDFFNQDIAFKLPKPIKTRRWILEVIRREKKRLAHLNYIFCSDEYLLALNQKYLKHKTLTDIITFDTSEIKGIIEADIFVSIERVRANAEELQIGADDEVHRVLIHGVLHLLGYSDKSKAQKTTMRKKEDAYLSLRLEL